MQGRLKRLLGATAAVAVLATGCSKFGDKKADDTPIHEAGKCDGLVEPVTPLFVVDDCGRTLVMRGVNVSSSSKGTTQAGSHLPATDLEDQAMLQTWGWNTVRFLVFWGAIEPEKGKFDEDYLDQVAKWVKWYDDHGIHVVLDMHQDLYGWKVNGNGAPDWAVDTRGLKVEGIEDGQPWYLQGADPAVQQAYQSFWNPKPDQPDLKVEYFKALTHLVKRFADEPAVIGYDVMNEPSFANGDLDATLAIQAEAAKGNFHNENLTAFMQDGIDAVRKADQGAYVFIEPTSLINAFPYPGDLIATKLKDPREGQSRIVYAGHLYEPSVHDGKGYTAQSTYVRNWEVLRTTEATAMKASLFFGEFGGDPAQPGMDQYVADVLAMSDRQTTGWAWWSWDPGGWSPVEADGKTLSRNGERLLRVQPRAITGNPKNWAWDPLTKSFEMTWYGQRDAVGPTELAVPSRLFPDGIEVVVDGRTVPEPKWDEETSVLDIVTPADSKEHEVCVAPTGSTSCVPA